MKPLDLINALRATDDYIEDIYMHGSCYQFHLFLKAIFPKAIPYLNDKKNHVYTKIGKDYHDILGVVAEEDEYYIQSKPMTEEDTEMAKEWSFANYNSLSLGDCDYCGEPQIVM